MLTELNVNELGISNNVFVIACNFMILCLLVGVYFLSVWYEGLSFYQTHSAAFNFVFEKTRSKMKFKTYRLYLCQGLSLIIQLLIFAAMYLTNKEIKSLSYPLKFFSALIGFFAIISTIFIFLKTMASIGNHYKQWQLAVSFYCNKSKTIFKANAFLARKVLNFTYSTLAAFSIDVVR